MSPMKRQRRFMLPLKRSLVVEPLEERYLMSCDYSTDATQLVYSTYLGGTNDDYGHAIAVDGLGNVYVTGETESNDFPTTPDALKRRNRNGTYDAFVTKFAEV